MKKVFAVQWSRADGKIFTNLVPTSSATTHAQVRKHFLSNSDGIVKQVLSVRRSHEHESVDAL
jgi:hypothetical protein